MYLFSRFRIVLSLLCAVSAFAASAAPTTSSADPVSSDGVAPEYVAFAHRIDSAMHGRDPIAPDSLLDRNALLDRAFAGLPRDASFEAGFRNATPVETSLHQELQAEGRRYTLLHVRRRGHETRALFRLLQGNGAVSYQDWVLAKDETGSVRAVDLYNASSGELISEATRRLYELALANHPSLVQRLMGKRSPVEDSAPKLLALMNAVKGGRDREGLEIIRSIPPPLDRSKGVLVLRFRLAAGLRASHDPDGEREYQEAMDVFGRTFPGDPAVDLLCLDQMLLDRQFAKAFAALDRIDAFTGGDAQLLFLRASFLMTRGAPEDLEAAHRALAQAISMEPTLEFPYWGMVTLSLKRQDYAETARWLTTVQSQLHVKLSMSAIEKASTYAGFVSSAEFKRWAAGQRE